MILFFFLLAVCGAICGSIFSWPTLWLISAPMPVVFGIYAYMDGGWSIIAVILWSILSIATFQVSAVLGGFLTEIVRARLARPHSPPKRID